MNQKKVCVLLSTYNGEKYLEELLKSVIAQDIENFEIFVRDDGSTDKTKQILDRYALSGRLTWYSGENLGPCQSFLELMRKSPEADYYAFCDQDDVWFPDKLSSAVNMLEKSDTDLKFYFSDYTPTDGELKELNIDHYPLFPFDLSWALMKNSAVGCTVVVSKGLRDKLNQFSPQNILMHDWWAYLVCIALGGEVLYDKSSHIFYRQHGDNCSGAFFQNLGMLQRLKRRIAGFEHQHWRSENARELLRGYRAEIIPSWLNNLEILSNYRDNFRAKVKFAASGRKFLGGTGRLFEWDVLRGNF